MKSRLRDHFSKHYSRGALRNRFNAANDGPPVLPPVAAPVTPPVADTKAAPDIKATPAAATPPGNDNLPRWNLADLYPTLNSPELATDQSAVEERAQKFQKDYETTIAYLSGPELAEAITEYEAIQNVCQKITCYVQLMEADNLNNFSKTESLKKWQDEVAEYTGFFEGEIGEMKERDLMTKLATPELAHYAPWIARMRAGHGDLIDGEVSAMSSEFASVNREAWRRLYYETLGGLRVDIDGKKLSVDEAHEIMSDDTMGVKRRKEIRAKIGDALEAGSKRMALIYNTMMKDTLLDMELRKFDRPDQEENNSNMLTPEVVDTMTATVKASYAKLSHRFYAWKAKQHGVEVMPRAMVGMPLPDAPQETANGYSFDDARKTILRAFKKFSPKFARIAQKFFDNKHIDAQPRPDKETGAFSMPTGPDNFPYVFMSYTNDVESLVTLGHELGHAVHQVLAEKKRGLFLSEMSTAVSETASIFAEMLVFEEMLSKEKDPAAKKDLLVEKAEGMILNGLQQLSYYDFEKQVHEARKKGELGVEEISDIWIKTQKEFFGPAVETDKYDRYYWMVVPHFFDSPFYVYSYSFAQNLVSGLYQSYKSAEKEGQAAREEFVENYIGLLETGITRNLYEMTKPFDLDPETPEFWEKGLSLIGKYLDDIEKMDSQPTPAAKHKPAKPKAPAP